MKWRLLIWILWPAFLVAGLAEGLIFTLVDPEDLHFFGQQIEASREAIYSCGFFILWAVCALSSALSLYMLPGAIGDMQAEIDRGLF